MLKIIETHEKFNEYLERYQIEIHRDDKRIASMSASDSLSECPEDATLNRDLNCIFNAIDFFKIGLEAGKTNEEVVYEEKYLNDEEEEITKEEFYN